MPFSIVSGLIVDDDAFYRGLVAEFLRRVGCESIVEAESGKASVPILRTRVFDVLVLDVEMDPIDGLQLTHLIRTQHNPNQETPILILTGHTEPDNVRRAMKSGATAVLAKPLSFTDFQNKLKQVLKRDRVQVAAQA